ncbi:MAG: WG repeat-containing protein [Desulfarculaceae bacterium]|nr:WG repeat-containing protein [Desulfarculaceae bacterium]MCF8102133.1 WG repeat-containing protein [Desulfarculaceae bacterium]MCF8118322.1 WG repeat-containing protein [Desulfarculaceae bacterium]
MNKWNRRRFVKNCLMATAGLTALPIGTRTFAQKSQTDALPMLLPVSDGALWGYIDRAGCLVVPLQFEYANEFHNGLASVQDSGSGHWGFVDSKGARVSKFHYAWCDDFYGGFAFAELPDQPGSVLIDMSGAEKRHVPYRLAGVFSEGLAPVYFDNEDSEPDWASRRWGYIDAQGRLVLDMVYDEVHSFGEGLALVRIGEKRGFIDQSGRFRLGPVNREAFLFAGAFSEGLAYHHYEDKYGFINQAGQIVIPHLYGDANRFCDGLAAVSEKGFGPYGFIDNTGHWVIDPIFFDAIAFSEGLAVVALEPWGPQGFIDLRGRVVIPPRFDSAHAFQGGVAMVQLGEVRTYIDHRGKILWLPS